MLVYHSDKSGFSRDVETGEIDEIILERFRARVGHGVGESERRAWHQSLTHMHVVLADEGIPAECGMVTGTGGMG